MQYVSMMNKAGTRFSYFAETPFKAAELAVADGRARKVENITITYYKPAPPDYHEGSAWRLLSTDKDEPLGWYGGGTVQPHQDFV